MKKYFSILIVCLICILSIHPIYASEELQLKSEYAYLYDPMTSLVYIDEKSQEKIYPASMTKILTVILAIEQIDNLQEKVRVTNEDLKGLIEEGASTAGFYENELVTYEDLLYGTLLPSGADACQTLSRLLFGNIDQMVNAMNQKIDDLGLKNSHFMNVTGLHDDMHYTTAYDMGKILEYALQNEIFVKIFEARSYTTSSQRLTWYSSLQRASQQKGIDTSFIDGGKSGYTEEAELTFASTMTIDGHQLILITAKAEGQRTQNHILDVVRVYQYMLSHYKDYILYRKDEELFHFFVLHSWQIYHTYQSHEDISILIDNSISVNDIQKQVTHDSLLFAGVESQTQLGLISVTYQGELLYQYPCLSEQEISMDISAAIVMYGCLLIIPVVIIYKKKKAKSM